MYVYSPIVEPTLVGDVTATQVRVVPIDHMPTRRSSLFPDSNVYYVSHPCTRELVCCQQKWRHQNDHFVSVSVSYSQSVSLIRSQPVSVSFRQFQPVSPSQWDSVSLSQSKSVSVSLSQPHSVSVSLNQSQSVRKKFFTEDWTWIYRVARPVCYHGPCRLDDNTMIVNTSCLCSVKFLSEKSWVFAPGSRTLQLAASKTSLWHSPGHGKHADSLFDLLQTKLVICLLV